MATAPSPVPKDPIQELARLPASAATKVAKAIETVPPFGNEEAIRKATGQVLPDSADLDTGQLVRFLSFMLGQFGDTNREDLARQLASAPQLNLPKNRRAAFVRTLTRILRSPIVSTIGKADDVITDHANVFRSARILTDIRPVFGDDVAELPEAAVIVEMLRVDHFVRGAASPTSFYVALDHADLLALRNVVDRAITKTETLQRFLASAGLSYYEHQEVVNAEPKQD